MPAQFVPLAERIVDALLDFSPDIARFAGDHRYDDRLPDFSPGAVARDVDMLREASAALSQVDDDELHPQERVDHAIWPAGSPRPATRRSRRSPSSAAGCATGWPTRSRAGIRGWAGRCGRRGCGTRWTPS